PRSSPRLVDRARRIHLVRAFYGRAFAEIRRFPATATGAVRASHGTVGVQSASRQTWCQCTLWLRGGGSRCARGDRLTWSERGARAGIGLSLGMISDLGDVYTTAIWIPFGGDAPGGRMRTNHSAATRAHRVSRALSSTKNPMNSAEPRNHDRILWLGLLALLLAAACGTSANPGPGTPDPIRTYRIRRLADSPVARNGHLAIGLADGSALVMGGNSSEAINLPDSSSTPALRPHDRGVHRGADARPERARPGVHRPSPAPCGC